MLRFGLTTLESITSKPVSLQLSAYTGTIQPEARALV